MLKETPLPEPLPLQTHDLTYEIWHPPADGKFESYTASDAAWMRPLGLGWIEHGKAAYFDVRTLETDELVGYTRNDPTKVRGMRRIQVRLIDGFRPPFMRAGCEIENMPQVREVEVLLRTMGVCDQRYRFWACQLVDVPALVDSKWICLNGPDNIDRFVNERLYEMEMRGPMPYWRRFGS